VPDHHLVLAAQFSGDGGQDDPDGADLDSPCGAGRAAADEHQQVVEPQRRLADGPVVDVVEARCAGEDGTRQDGESAIIERQGAEGPRIVPLSESEDCGAQHQQRQRARDGKTRVDAPPGPVAATTTEEPVTHLEQHREAKPAQHDCDTDRHDDRRVADKADQVVAEQGKTGVVECRDCVEDPVPSGRCPAVGMGTEGQGEHERYQGFNGEHHLGDHPRHAKNRAQAGVELLAGDQRPLQGYPAGDHESEQAGEGHDPEAANLDERHDDELSNRAPVGGGVNGGQSGYADCGNSCERRMNERRRLTTGRGHRKQEKRGTDGDSGQVHRWNHPRRMAQPPCEAHDADGIPSHGGRSQLAVNIQPGATS